MWDRLKAHLIGVYTKISVYIECINKIADGMKYE